MQINYLQNRERTNTIQRIQSLAQVEQVVAQRLDACATELVLYLEDQEQLNFAKMVADYSLLYPQRVMESPEVVVNLYPEQGEKQIVELSLFIRAVKHSCVHYKTELPRCFLRRSNLWPESGPRGKKQSGSIIS